KKYCDHEKPRLSIQCRYQSQTIVIDFIDNGSGIPRADQAVVFEKFARASDQRKAGSAGLGLAICREIMVNLDGAITYVPGQGGAAFRVTLPLHDNRVKA
ncbi:MAG: ATP-binding protein, partial [Pseudomonadota bacterium]